MANAQRNGLTGTVEASEDDAGAVLSRNPGGFDLVDLDPYGSAAPFFDAAVHALLPAAAAAAAPARRR